MTSQSLLQPYIPFFVLDCQPNDNSLCFNDLICYQDTCHRPKHPKQSCDENDDCSSLACVAGVCELRFGLGYPCDDPQDCSLGLSIDCSNGVCGGNGANCSLNDDALCRAGLVCINSACSAVAALGDNCEDDTDCSSGRCISDVCSEAANLGEPCDSNTDCGGLLMCSTSQSICGGDQAPCSQNRNDLCVSSLVCVAGYCSSQLQNGQPCTENDDCASRACITGVCSNAGLVGDTCDPYDSQDCAGNIECADTVCGGLDAACGGNDDTLCNGAFVCINGRCSTLSTLNGDCDASNSDCAGPYVCVHDKCVNPSPASGNCDVTDGNTDCAEPLTCALSGICGGVGSDCGYNDDSLCATSNGLVCVQGSCQRPKSNGGSCDENDDCRNVCIFGVCDTVSRIGEQCDASNDCENGVTCGSQLCGGEGATCDNNEDHWCQNSLVCLPGGMCGAPLSASASCDENGDCSSPLTCIESHCTSKSNIGGECDVNDDSDCATLGVTCSPEAVCGGEGAKCIDNQDSLCTSPFFCINGICAPPLENGASCEENHDCLNTCISGVCAQPASIGQSCDAGDPTDCENEFSCGDESQPICGGSGSVCNTATSNENDDALCTAPLVCVDFVCRGKVENGGNCDTNSDCVSLVCVADVCQKPGSLGDACDSDEGAKDCQSPLVCSPIDGRCGGDNAMCSNNNDSLCFNGRSCIAGHCSFPAINGHACDTANSECSSGHCIRSVCASASSIGENCDVGDDSDCASSVGCGPDGRCGSQGSFGCGNNDDQCLNGLVCSFNQCVDRLPNGDACDGDNADCIQQCVSNSCQEASAVGGYCDVGDNTDCIPSIFCGSNGVCGGIFSDCNANNDEACDEGLRCVFGKCQAPISAGESCDNDNDDCQEGLTCVHGKCVHPSRVGDECDDASDCEGATVDCSPVDGRCGGESATCPLNDDAHCIPNMHCIMGECDSLVNRGGDCAENKDCASSVCVFGSCTIKSSVSRSCDETADCMSPLACSNFDEICGGSGAVCLDNNDANCAGNYRCVNGTCAILQSTGSPCVENLDCASSVCIAQTCRSQPSERGGPCDVGQKSDCDNGLDCGQDSLCGGNLAVCNYNQDFYCTEELVCIQGHCNSQQPTGSSCSETADCQDRCIDNVCALPSGPGGRCQDLYDCQHGLDCSRGICGGPGAHCTATSQCQSQLMCLQETCSDPFPVDHDCLNNTDCRTSSCIANVCRVPQQPGGSCDAGDSADCEGNFGCGLLDARCGGNGALCPANNDQLCLSELVCVSGVCSTERDNGERCEEDADCVSFSCSADGWCHATNAVGSTCQNDQYCVNSHCSERICGGLGAQVCSSSMRFVSSQHY